MAAPMAANSITLAIGKAAAPRMQNVRGLDSPSPLVPCATPLHPVGVPSSAPPCASPTVPLAIAATAVARQMLQQKERRGGTASFQVGLLSSAGRYRDCRVARQQASDESQDASPLAGSDGFPLASEDELAKLQSKYDEFQLNSSNVQKAVQTLRSFLADDAEKPECQAAVVFLSRMTVWMMKAAPMNTQIHIWVLNLMQRVEDAAKEYLEPSGFLSRVFGEGRACREDVLDRLKAYIEEVEEIRKLVKEAQAHSCGLKRESQQPPTTPPLEKDQNHTSEVQEHGEVQEEETIEALCALVIAKFSGSKATEATKQRLKDATQKVADEARALKQAEEIEGKLLHQKRVLEEQCHQRSGVVQSCADLHKESLEAWQKRREKSDERCMSNLENYTNTEEPGALGGFLNVLFGGGSKEARAAVDRSKEELKEVKSQVTSAAASVRRATKASAKMTAELEAVKAKHAASKEQLKACAGSLQEAREELSKVEREAQDLMEGHGHLSVEQVTELRKTFEALDSIVSLDRTTLTSYFVAVDSVAKDLLLRLRGVVKRPRDQNMRNLLSFLQCRQGSQA
eukprot:CAMPEP_0178423334 /NCGR_PEP_ID=MMETSP0689_2-20121128/27633_1 /TAXON_ID=160604 /ORGANISM="Amphidinium massartii, Strain CS-259" /LENGTH=569 /DNA_ID=CAMNT_0020044921 /DNA_START=77 /DNA_END=1786 /DNA_ORIENTATION=+